jgi:spore maturation protein CgeB
LAYNDLLASTKVIVGDGWRGADRYVSNRAFETIGRGGFCVHPAVPGLVEMLPAGMGVDYFPPGDWDTMCRKLEGWVEDEDDRAKARAEGQAFVRSNHTYTNRMRYMLDVMRDEGAWG